jgi:hypothetical protein
MWSAKLVVIASEPLLKVSRRAAVFVKLKNRWRLSLVWMVMRALGDR